MEATLERPFINKLGMRFYSVNYPGAQVLFSRTETTRTQFGGGSASGDDGELPVSNVSINEAEAWARQITQVERQAGVIPQNWRYRLPTLREWLHAASGGEKKWAHIWGAWGANAPLPHGFGNINSKAVIPVAKTLDYDTSFSLRDLCGNVEEMTYGDDPSQIYFMGGS